jgi:hypothetical protein
LALDVVLDFVGILSLDAIPDGDVIAASAHIAAITSQMVLWNLVTKAIQSLGGGAALWNIRLGVAKFVPWLYLTFFSGGLGALGGNFLSLLDWFHSSTFTPCDSNFLRWALNHACWASLWYGIRCLQSLLCGALRLVVLAHDLVFQLLRLGVFACLAKFLGLAVVVVRLVGRAVHLWRLDKNLGALYRLSRLR